MFGKTIKPENTSAVIANGGEENREAAIIESIMRFTGAKNLDELEEVVNGAEKMSLEDKKTEDEVLFGAVKSVKNDHSFIEAKEMENNEDFVKAVLAGFSSEKAFMLANFDKLLGEAFEEGVKKGKQSVEIKKDRVGEEGTKVSGGYKAEIDPANMTMDDLKKIKERLRKGESVRL